jgi:hypothetical protein
MLTVRGELYVPAATENKGGAALGSKVYVMDATPLLE